MDKFKFYVQMDGQEFGPYDLDEIKNLPLLEDTLVTEEHLGGEWVKACEIPFGELEHLSEPEENSPEPPLIHPPLPQDPPCADSDEPEPPILNSWNWGAFILSCVWAVANDIYWPILIIACNIIPYVGPIASLAICVYLGMCGNKLAWKHSNLSEEEFTYKQAQWNKAGLIFFILSLLICILVFLIKL